MLSRQGNFAVFGGGFILARILAHAPQIEQKAASGLLRDLPFMPDAFTADSGFGASEGPKHRSGKLNLEP